jgi:hypothetical protein
LEAYAAKQAVATVNADVVCHIDAQEPIKTINVHGSRLQYEANLKEKYSAYVFVVETRRKDVINDDKFVAKGIIVPRDEWNKLTHEQKDR